MDVKEIILIALVIGAGYWAYDTYFQGGRASFDEVQWQKNASEMRKCIDREITFSRLSATSGVASSEERIESACAERLNFYLEDGHWKGY